MKIFVGGSSGFIGGHLVRRLRSEGHYVVGADLVHPPYSQPDEFHECDLRNPVITHDIFLQHKFDQVFNLACIMGGMGFIGDPAHNFDVMVGSTKIVINVLDAAIRTGVKKIFYSSSACVYNQFLQEDPKNMGLKESDAYPAFPDLVYGWQKLFSEQLHQAASDRIEVRIARFHNIYGPEGTYKGGKEKAPAAMCRKVIEAVDPEHSSCRNYIDVWGKGDQTRSFLYIDDCIDAVLLLMNSDHKEPINIGSEEMVSINLLAAKAIVLSGKKLLINNVAGPVGVQGRNSDNTMIRRVLGWEPKFSLYEGLTQTFNWIRSHYERNV